MSDIIEIILTAIGCGCKKVWNFITSWQNKRKELEKRIEDIENQLKSIKNLQEEHYKCRSCKRCILV